MNEEEFRDRNILERFNPYSKDEDIFVNYPDVALTTAERNLIAGLVTDYLISLAQRSNLKFVDHIETYQALVNLATELLKKIARDRCKIFPSLCKEEKEK